MYDMLSTAVCCAVVSAVVCAQGADTESVNRHALLVPGRFIQIPGPNPILVPGGSEAWDDGVALPFLGARASRRVYPGARLARG